MSKTPTVRWLVAEVDGIYSICEAHGHTDERGRFTFDLSHPCVATWPALWNVCDAEATFPTRIRAKSYLLFDLRTQRDVLNLAISKAEALCPIC